MSLCALLDDMLISQSVQHGFVDLLQIGLIAALLFAAWNTDIKIDKISGRIDRLTETVNGIKGETETIRKIVK